MDHPVIHGALSISLRVENIECMQSDMMGYLQIYTGNGKGKSTAAFGLALRAAGAGMSVYIAQFVKGRNYSEITAVRQHLPQITIRQFGRGCFIVERPTDEDVAAAREGLAVVSEVLNSGAYDMVILDEATIAIYYDLFTVGELIEILKTRAAGCEVVVTGRYAPEELIEVADLVTEMREVKHYYRQGIEAREGIEY
jgi:cob(I)alamin adenosyltransferase